MLDNTKIHIILQFILWVRFWCSSSNILKLMALGVSTLGQVWELVEIL